VTVCLSYTQFRHDFAMWANGGLPSTDLAIDGLERWPVENLRINGFDGGIDIVGTDMASQSDVTIPFQFDMPAAADCAGFLSVRTEAQPWFLLTNPATGSLLVAFTAAGFAANGNSATIPLASVPRFFKHMHVYFCRKSDGAIQWIDFEKRLAARGVP